MAYVLLAAMLWAGPRDVAAYSVLTHQAIIDLSWNNVIRPLLLSRYPRTTEAELQEAHAYAYGGCAIQDAGYYPFSRQFFSDLTHYVRTGDFVESLLRNARNVNEYAFALGALSHYVSDSVGHADAISPATAIEYPRLAKKYGPIVTYENAPREYVATEFSFDVDQVTRRRFAPTSYQRRIGLWVPHHLLEQAFFETYGLTFTAVMGKTEPASIRSYRTSIRNFIPGFAQAEVVLHRSKFPKGDPPSFETIRPYLRHVPYLPAWANAYRDPSIVQHLLAGVIWILPPIGVMRILKIRGPCEHTEELYYSSLKRTLTLYQRRLDELRLLPAMPLGLPNRDLDTGDWTKPGAYEMTDRTYAKLLREITEKPKHAVPPGLKQDILNYYAVPDAPIATKRDRDEWKRVQIDLARLREMPTSAVAAGEGME
jgi:zinc dependent phospholipase C